jgi:hypothetical protein
VNHNQVHLLSDTISETTTNPSPIPASTFSQQQKHQQHQGEGGALGSDGGIESFSASEYVASIANLSDEAEQELTFDMMDLLQVNSMTSLMDFSIVFTLRFFF